MESAGNKLVGEHDFRNFCKMDAANVHNYRRRIMLFEISPTDVRLRLVDIFLTHILVFLCVHFCWQEICTNPTIESKLDVANADHYWIVVAYLNIQ